MINNVQFGAVYTVSGPNKDVEALTPQLKELAQKSDTRIATIEIANPIREQGLPRLAEPRYHNKSLLVMTEQDASEDKVALAKDLAALGKEANVKHQHEQKLRAELRNIDGEEARLLKNIRYKDTKFDLTLSRNATKTEWLKNKIKWALIDLKLKAMPAISDEKKSRQAELLATLLGLEVARRERGEAIKDLSNELFGDLVAKNRGNLGTLIVADRIKMGIFNVASGNFTEPEPQG